MPAIQQIINSRQRRHKQRDRTLTRRLSQITFFVLVLLCLIIAISTIAGTYFFATMLTDTPSHEALLPYFNDLANGKIKPTTLYDRSHQHKIAVLENPNARGNKYLELEGIGGKDELPESIVLAAISSTEPNFWQNPGISLESLQEHDRPTIAQMITRDFLLDQSSTSGGKQFQEWLLAAQLINTYGHEQILEWYLNSAYFGNFAFGVDAAARIYFGKSATDLNLAEAASLMAAANNPSINPMDAPLASSEEKSRILSRMYEQKLITRSQLESALERKLIINSARDFPINVEPAFTTRVIDQLSHYIPEEQIFRGGLDIITTLDFDLQNQVDCSVDFQFERVSPQTSSTEERSSFDGCEMARLLPAISSTYDDNQELSIAADVLVMDPKQGQVLAFVSNSKEDTNQGEFATHTPGTILSPFIYLTAFTRGLNPATLLWDIPANIPSLISDIDQEIDQFQGPVDIRTSMSNDYLVPALQVLAQMDPAHVWQTARRMGLNDLPVTSGKESYELLIEGGEIDLIELSQAYGVLANQGVLAGMYEDESKSEQPNSPIDPQFILGVLDPSGNILLDCRDQITDCYTTKRPIVSQELAYLVTDVLSDETARWPSLGHPNPLEIGRPAAVKIGSTRDKAGSWTIGYTPDLLVGVWAGIEGRSPSTLASSDLAAGLWHAIIQHASKEFPAEKFPIPGNIVEIAVCSPSGMLPTMDCPQVKNEIFLSGNEPSQSDNLYRTYQVNSETGRLATIFTPPALIEDTIFLDFPAEAEEWALEAGLPKIPADYDVLDIATNQKSESGITSPPMFGTIKGHVKIIGSAAGDGFESYQLQIGSGLNPDSWYQVGDVETKPVVNGLLGEWDTSGLNGLYVIQMLVSYQDDEVISSIVQVTVDNDAPEISLRYPENEAKIDSSGTGSIMLLADVSDNLGVKAVEFYVDGDLISTLESPPFAVPWQLEVGDHIIRIRAYDHAGNSNSARIKFQVE